jgi:hypothetical protein
MLAPLYKSYVSPDSKQISPPPEGTTFAINYFSKIGIYTLVGWSLSSGGEAITGETLWRDRTPIAVEGGQLRLYADKNPSTSVWDIINPDIGKYGVPSQIAIALRQKLVRLQDAG